MTRNEWKGEMTFLATTSTGHQIVLDASSDSGGRSLGPSPKELLLVSLSGCTGMDVVSILRKMKVEGYTFRMEVIPHSTEQHPKIYDKILLKYIFHFEGEPPKDKVEKAIQLSQERYCGVSAMLKESSELHFEIEYE
mgnify:CR=1 FL=1